MTGDITVTEVKAKLDRKDDFTFVDVREPHEWQIGRIAGTLLMPMNDVPKRLGELNPDSEIVVHCKMGGRSAKVVEFLKANGYPKARNMVGGILAWSEKIDPSIPKY